VRFKKKGKIIYGGFSEILLDVLTGSELLDVFEERYGLF
jgi:hypothetical protein